MTARPRGMLIQKMPRQPIGSAHESAVERPDDAAGLAGGHQDADGQRLHLAAESESDHAHGDRHDGAAADRLDRPEDRQPFEAGRQGAHDRSGHEDEDGDVEEQAVAQQVGEAAHRPA